MNAEDISEWLVARVAHENKEFSSMGEMEVALAAECRNLCRSALELMVQSAADSQPEQCSRCGNVLAVKDRKRERTVHTSSGHVTFRRCYGYCRSCADYDAPADSALNLHERATSSPKMQEICALLALRAPAGQAEEDAARLTGLRISESTIHREARRQGRRALEIREEEELLTQTQEGTAELSGRACDTNHPFTLIIEIDAWNIRERDNWGATKDFSRRGEDTGRWHWVRTATVFRLDQRGTDCSGRPVISERGYVATRKDSVSFTKQIHAEALQRGLAKADSVLVIADGAVWIWNIVKGRFSDATQRVDLYHVKEHLWSLARDLHPGDPESAGKWVRPYLRWLTSRKNGALDIIRELEEIKLDDDDELKKKALERELGYMKNNKVRMDYKNGKSLGQPVGSGAIESTCSQYQRRFKMTGQFWSLEGDEEFLALYTLHRNKRWHLLFPFD